MDFGWLKLHDSNLCIISCNNPLCHLRSNLLRNAKHYNNLQRMLVCLLTHVGCDGITYKLFLCSHIGMLTLQSAELQCVILPEQRARLH